MGDNPHANGGILLRDLKMPDFRDYAVEVTNPALPMQKPLASWVNSCGM
jgi:xylulose-5-phosphate/fructose-6-phosphate phosphoketolase